MRRLGPPLLGIGGVALFMALTTGAGTGAAGGLFGMLLFGGVVWLVAGWARRRRPGHDGGWTPVAAVAFQPAVGHSASAPGVVVLALGRVEAREIASSASIGVGVGFCLMILVLFGQVWAAEYRGGLSGSMELHPIYVHPLAGLVVLAAHRARTRSTRDGTQELFETCPTSQATRTAGHLLTSWVPAAIALVFLTGMTVLVSRNATGDYSQVGARQVAALLGAAVLCVGATALGVGLARWAPWTLVPVVVVIAIGFGSTSLANAGNRRTDPIRQLSTFLNDPDRYLRHTAPHWVAHHLWILALVALVAVLALARDLHRPRLAIAGATFAIVAVVSAVAATRPIDATDAARIASLIDEPEAHQRCVDVAELGVCTYPTDAELADHIAAEVAQVAAAAPPGALAGWTVRQGTDLDRAELDPEVRRLLQPGRGDERFIPMEMINHSAADEGARFWVALTAAGVTEDITKGTVLSLDHQARGVVALWLATRGAATDTAVDMTSTELGDHDSANYSSSYGRPWPDNCYAGLAPVTWAFTDVDAARQLLAVPEAEVAEVLRSEWARFTDPATSTDELLAALGLEPVTPRPGTTRSGDAC